MAASPSLVPQPKSIELHGGKLLLAETGRIVVTAEELAPLSRVLAREIELVTGLRLKPASGPAHRGDIVLHRVDRLSGETHTVAVQDRAEVSGRDLHAVALGTTTLLQSMDIGGPSPTIPHMHVVDEPRFSYRGLMVDVARHRHYVDVLKRLIVLARYYKIRYLQLHLTDDESFTFPSRAFPDLPTPGRYYTLEELRELEDFACARGVTLVPELDVPGHSASLRRVAPFSITGRNVIDMTSEEVYEALEQIVTEICDVFSSPYIHIGADESDLTGVGTTQAEKDYMDRHGLEDSRDLEAHFIVRMNEIVKKHHRQTLLWEGFRGKGTDRVQIPRDVLVLSWDTRYQLPAQLLDHGYEVINASWKPLYVTSDKCWSPETIYAWNPYRWEHWDEASPSSRPIQLEPRAGILGAQMCAWEQPGEMELPSLRSRLPAMSERLWQPDAETSFADFENRLLATDARLGRLLGSV